MKDLNDLYFFVQVVEHGGFAPAGRALGLPKSRLSRRIAALEDRLGARLLQRSSRRFAVTEIGQTYYRHCKAMLVEADAAEESVAVVHAEPCGTVRMSCPVLLLDLRVAAMLADFMAEYPRVEIQLEDTNRRVDVIGEGLDLAIRVRPPPLEDSDLVLRVLGESGQCLVAAPALLARHPPPAGPADLAGFPSLDLGVAQGEHLWRLHGPDGDEVAIPHRPRLVTRSLSALRAAALAGVTEVVLDGETGFVVPSDAAGDLADRVVQLLVDPDLRRRLGEAARRRCWETFGVTATAASWRSLVATLAVRGDS